MKVYSIKRKSGKINPDDVSSRDVPEFEESEQILERSDHTIGFSATISVINGYYEFKIEKDSHILRTFILNSGEGKKPEVIHSFWMEVDEYNDNGDHHYGSFQRFYVLLMFKKKFVQVIYFSQTFTEIVSAFNFDHESVIAAPNGQFFQYLEMFCDSESQTDFQDLNFMGQMCCQNGGEATDFSMASLNIFTNALGEYLYFWGLSVKFCEETQEFKSECLYISFRTGFGIVPQDFGLTFDDHYFSLHFAIVIDGNTYPVNFHLNNFGTIGFGHDEDTFIQSVFSDKHGCTYYYGENIPDQCDRLQRIAKLEIEIPGFVPPEDDSDLKKSLNTLPHPTADFLRRLIWRQLSPQ
jgi:hypothetical protein